MITKTTLWFWCLTHSGIALLLFITGHALDASLVAMIGPREIPLLSSLYFRSPWWLAIFPVFFLAIALWQTYRPSGTLDFTPLVISIGSATLVLILFGFLLAVMVAYLTVYGPIQQTG